MREIVPICGIGIRSEGGLVTVYIESPDGLLHDVLSTGPNPASFVDVQGLRDIIERHGQLQLPDEGKG